MSESFVAYIDESGDEGFNFREGRSSSKWFVLSTAISRKENEHELVSLMEQVRMTLRKDSRYTVHFRNLKHEQKVVTSSIISTAKIRAISILCDKTKLTETEYLREKNKLYFYLVKFLFERISWLCRDNRKNKKTSDGSVKIVFSNRSGMSYSEITEYMEILKEKSKYDDSIKVDWNVIKSDQISALPHHLRAVLQIVDIIASSFFASVEPSSYGFTEHGYAKNILPVVYKYRGKRNGYGIKIWPREAISEITQDTSYEWMQ